MGVYCRAGGCWSITLIKLPVSCLCIVGRNWKYTLETAEEKAWVILLYTKEDTEGKKGCHRAETELWMELMSLVWGQWARRQKNQSFTQCLSLKRAVMMTGLAGCSFTCKVMRVGEKVGGGGVLKRWSRMRNLSKENMFLFSVSSLSLTVLRHVCYFLIHSKGGMAVRYTVAQSKRYKQTERKAHMVQSVYWRS